MNSFIRTEWILWALVSLMTLLSSCKKNQTEIVKDSLALTVPTENESFKEPSQQFKDYWYAGEAEITSYQLSQARYGELRDGKAVLIYVTEDLRPDTQVKADYKKEGDVSVLKLNATKKFNTGIYPYSVMQSTFYPVQNEGHALKVTASMQEWCGHVYTQINNRDKFEVMSHSYFEKEGDQDFEMDKAILENELWIQLRIDPSSLPTGDLEVVPNLEYIRFSHIPIKAFQAKAELKDGNYTISYPELRRSLSINFNPEFPYIIEGWEEKTPSSSGELVTTAKKLEQIKSAYWSQNSNSDEKIRETLQLQ